MMSEPAFDIAPEPFRLHRISHLSTPAHGPLRAFPGRLGRWGPDLDRHTRKPTADGWADLPFPTLRDQEKPRGPPLDDGFSEHGDDRLDVLTHRAAPSPGDRNLPGLSPRRRCIPLWVELPVTRVGSDEPRRRRLLRRCRPHAAALSLATQRPLASVPQTLSSDPPHR